MRVIAATHRDLRAEVNAGRFRGRSLLPPRGRAIPMPPLRAAAGRTSRRCSAISSPRSHATPEEAAALRAPKVIARLQRAAWPGNVRELRNYVEQYLVFRAAAARRASSRR